MSKLKLLLTGLLVVMLERPYEGRLPPNRHPLAVIQIELDREDGRWLYELKLLPPSGRVFELEVDATTAALLRSKGQVQERR